MVRLPFLGTRGQQGMDGGVEAVVYGVLSVAIPLVVGGSGVGLIAGADVIRAGGHEPERNVDHPIHQHVYAYRACMENLL